MSCWQGGQVDTCGGRWVRDAGLAWGGRQRRGCHCPHSLVRIPLTSGHCSPVGTLQMGCLSPGVLCPQRRAPNLPGSSWVQWCGPNPSAPRVLGRVPSQPDSSELKCCWSGWVQQTKGPIAAHPQPGTCHSNSTVQFFPGAQPPVSLFIRPTVLRSQ